MLERFNAWLDGLVNVARLPAQPYPPGETGAFIWHFVRQHRNLLAAAYALTLISAATNAFGPYVLRHMVDIMLAAANKAAAWHALQGPLLFYVLVCLLLSMLAWLGMALLRAFVMGSGMTHMIRRQMHWYVLQHGWSFFQNDYAGRVASRVMDTGSEIRGLVNVGRHSMLIMATFVVGAVTLGMAQPLLLVPFVLWLAGNVAAIVVLVPRIRKLALAFADMRSMCVGKVVDSYTNIQTVKLFAAMGRENDDAAAVFAKTRKAHVRLQRANLFLDIIALTLEFFLVSSMLLVSLWMWRQGLATPGTVAMVVPLTIMLVKQSDGLREDLGNLLESVGTLDNVVQTMVKPVDVQDRPRARMLKVNGGAIALEGVRFSYREGDRPVFEDLTLRIASGEKVGLVGPSGAGKSTLANLLLRFFDVQGGRITIDGQDISKVKQDSLRAAIGMVTQDTSLLHRSIAENIAYGKPGASMDEVVAAAKKAHAHDFITSLADKDGNQGYAARVGERGVKLSGGQRQRIAIARLILKNAPILILDEATSALDSEVEQAIQENLAVLMKGKTVIAIAHRLSTISQLDRLVVLEGGQIVEDGTHKELLRRRGLYARLWAHQSGGFLPSEDEA